MANFRSLRGKRVYVDTNVIIYSAEGFESLASMLGEFFRSMESGEFQGVTSEITLMEALIRPIKEKNTRLIEHYEFLLSRNSSVLVLPVDRRILKLAATIRATSNAKPIDAIHAATAQDAECDLIVSDDRRLIAPSMTIISLSEMTNG